MLSPTRKFLLPLALRRSGTWTGRVHRGFTLIEILVVVVIVALLAATQVTQLLRARIIANEQGALNNLRVLAKSCYFFSLSHNRYPTALDELTRPTSDPPFVNDLNLLAGAKQGYVFSYMPEAGAAPSAFTILTNPQTHGITGGRHFYVDHSLAIHVTDQNRDAAVSDPVEPL